MKTLTTLFVILGLCDGAFAAPATLPATKPLTKAEQLFQDGRDALYRGDYTQAVELLRQAAAEDKTKSGYRVHLARALEQLKQTDEAERILADVLKSTPDHIEAGQLLGEIYFKQQNWKKVVELLESLLKFRHDYATYHLLAEAKYNLSDLEAARKYYEEAIKLNAASGPDHYQLGNIYLAGNFFALAADSYQNALRLGVQSPILHYKLASSYFNLRNYFGSISVVTVKSGKPLGIDGDWYLIEPVPGKKDTFRAAPAASDIYQVGKTMEGLGQTPELLLLRANIYLNAARYEQAHAMFKEIESKVSTADKALFYYYYAQAAFGIGQYDDYLRLLGEAIKLDKAAYEPTLVDAYVKVADQYNSAGDLEKYITFMQKAVSQSPQTASLHLKLGYAFEESQKYDQAVAQWKMVLELEPDHPKRLDLLNAIVKYAKPPATRPA